MPSSPYACSKIETLFGLFENISEEGGIGLVLDKSVSEEMVKLFKMESKEKKSERKRLALSVRETAISTLVRKCEEMLDRQKVVKDTFARDQKDPPVEEEGRSSHLPWITEC